MNNNMHSTLSAVVATNKLGYQSMQNTTKNTLSTLQTSTKTVV